MAGAMVLRGGVVSRGLTAAALGLFAAGAALGGSMAGTAHDAGIYGASDQVCTACHLLPGSETSEPLWSEPSAEMRFAVYAPAAHGASGQPGAVSKLCLSCHDGALGVSDYVGSSNSGGGRMAGHPVGVDYNAALAGAEGRLADPMRTAVTIGVANRRYGNIAADMLIDGRVECPSCHDVHNTYTAPGRGLMKVSMSGSSLCFKCHNK